MFDIISGINDFLWNKPLLLMLCFIHMFFTVRTGFIQRKIGTAIRLSVSGGNGSSTFSTLMMTLAATLGTGNIIGVSTAIYQGGAGAVFWCWLTGIFGMATTYAECYLGTEYRRVADDGEVIGGPMAAMEYGAKSPRLALLYCIAVLVSAFCMGGTTQSQAAAEIVKSEFGINNKITGIILLVLTGSVIIAGANIVKKVCTYMVPFMGLIYIAGCILILYINRDYFGETFKVIFQSIGSSKAVTGGILGGTLQNALRYGVTKGLFTNEAGLGSTAIMAAEADMRVKSREQALVSMSATFWDTVVMCAITGLAAISSILSDPVGTEYISEELLTRAFSKISFMGGEFLAVAVAMFALATLIGWSHIGEKTVKYICHLKKINNVEKKVTWYKTGYLIMIFLGVNISMSFIWELADLANALMAIPNIIMLILLRKNISS